MGIIHQKLLGVKRLGGGLLVVAAGVLAGRMVQAQLPPGFGQSTDFSSVEYYEEPFDQQVKTRLTGAQSLPVPGSPGELEVKQLRIENYNTNGALEVVISAPECIYSNTPAGATARSSGPLAVSSGDGKSKITGVGFLWRQSDTQKQLSISNQVETVISESALPHFKNQKP